MKVDTVEEVSAALAAGLASDPLMQNFVSYLVLMVAPDDQKRFRRLLDLTLRYAASVGAEVILQAELTRQ